eukprot:TRINITY_DN12246_c0_g1_i1.p1 TRINITY_DN12246_c0_g1~~TRINITY_DN12246_c0_g1_i1.p1  ORF type:complete len:307 (-),score=47.25 TRINITY_DN12246_c0_g1_i1:157-1077(-)
MVRHFGLDDEAALWMNANGFSSRSGALKHFLTSDSFLSSDSMIKPRGRSTQASSFHGAGAHHEAKHDGEHGEAKDGEKKEEEGLHCFPASALVYVKGRGSIRLDEVQAGDLLLSGDESNRRLSFSPFLGHLHREVKTALDFVALRTAASSTPLLISQEHLVFTASSPSERFVATRASTLQKGQWIRRMGCDGDLCAVQLVDVSQELSTGLYAPLTESGTVLVNGILCSCYADAWPKTSPEWLRNLAATHEAAHGALLPWRLACRLTLAVAASAGPRRDEKEELEGIHPYCRTLMALPAAAKALTVA